MISDTWLIVFLFFSSWMGGLIIYILFGYPIKMMIRDEELRTERLRLKVKQ